MRLYTKNFGFSKIWLNCAFDQNIKSGMIKMQFCSDDFGTNGLTHWNDFCNMMRSFYLYSSQVDIINELRYRTFEFKAININDNLSAISGDVIFIIY